MAVFPPPVGNLRHKDKRHSTPICGYGLHQVKLLKTGTGWNLNRFLQPLTSSTPPEFLGDGSHCLERHKINLGNSCTRCDNKYKGSRTDRCKAHPLRLTKTEGLRPGIKDLISQTLRAWKHEAIQKSWWVALSHLFLEACSVKAHGRQRVTQLCTYQARHKLDKIKL